MSEIRMLPRTPWWLAAAIALAAAAAIALVWRGGQSPRGGRGSAADVIEATFAAYAVGDVEALVALADPGGLYALAVDCARDGDADSDRDAETDEHRREAGARDPREVVELERAKYRARIAAVGRPLDVLAIGEPGTPGTVARGAPMMAGCTAKTDVRFHRFPVQIRVAGRQQTVSIGLTEAAGRWFLSTPPAFQ